MANGNEAKKPLTNEEISMMITRLGDYLDGLAREVAALKKDSNIKDNYIQLLEEKVNGLSKESLRLMSALFKIVKYGRVSTDGVRVPAESVALQEPLVDINQTIDKETNEVVFSLKEV